MIVEPTDDLDEIYETVKKKQKSRHRSILDQLNDIDANSEELSEVMTPEPENIRQDNDTFLPSSFLDDKRKSQPKKTMEDEPFYTNMGIGIDDDYDPDLWFSSLVEFQSPKMDKKKIHTSYFDENGIFVDGKRKKKKKKDKEKSKLTDFKKEFEPEIALYKNLLLEQTKFTKDLQKEYDHYKNTKATSRGVSKQVTDLIENITSARALAMQLVDKNVNAKKLIAELSMKQRKEMGLDSESLENMNEFGSMYLRSMMENRKAAQSMGDDTDIMDMEEDELFDELTQTLDNDEESLRTDDANKFLEYEKKKVVTYVIIGKDDDGRYDFNDYDFLAYDENGDIIEDYPLPVKTKLSVNTSTNIATDEYANKYPIKWVE